MGDPVVKVLDGTYHHDQHKHIMEWKLPVIDQSTTTGNLEFTIQGGTTEDFFHIRVTFTSPKLYCRLQVCVCLCVHACVYVFVGMGAHVWALERVRVCKCVCMCACICMMAGIAT